ncbi:hypothetical protein GDO86_020478 [Hymenochirus boettgeri]|uniref:Mitochondrial import inner membrane translocase subunit n=1 Tax=Hymenochirus boettgeri TaxID=247094 RepID=A0A8T2IBT4_9PIPI|nr:hypothetical protein GDO86_020478 [Hymenochirus boettgeri]KAG8430504.1 hypothetical protein GDO86_020478 [Hymenochirus boettgeri]KAG8430505.1 hypothetical protein GDO86_020478 [Hymenochirus boettgeri]
MDAEQQQLRNLRDFLLVYNKMAEICFNRCAKNFNYRSVTMEEEKCVDSCAAKLIHSNHRLMAAYVLQMPKTVQRRMAEYEKKSSEGAPSNMPDQQEASSDSTSAGNISNSVLGQSAQE